MELRHLRYFVAVAERLSFTAAADSLGVSQPPLSQQIRDLEAELGVALFERSSRRVSLTPAGLDFLERARTILAQAREAADRAQAIGRGTAGILNVGLTGSMLVGPLGALIRRFQQRFPDIDLRIHEMPPAGQIAALKERRTDLSFLRSPPTDADLVAEIAWREEVGLVLPRDHPLARRPSLTLDALRNEPYISLRLKDSRFANELWNACVAAGFVPLLSQQVVEAASLTSLAAAGLGIALVPEFVAMLSHPRVVFRRLAPPAPSADVYALRPRGTGIVVETFLASMRSEAAALAEQLRAEHEPLRSDARAGETCPER